VSKTGVPSMGVVEKRAVAVDLGIDSLVEDVSDGFPAVVLNGRLPKPSLPVAIHSLAFGTPFYCDYGVSAAPDDVTSMSATGPASVAPAMFTTTNWSVVLQAQSESPAAQEALENLCRTYWRPIYSFVRREGARPEEAKDITQGFFALILERKDFSSVRQERGRLRSFLLAALKHFMANERRDAATLKRGGGRTLIPLDEAESYDVSDFDRSDMLSADLLYDRKWAFTVLDRVFARLREESQGSANTPLLDRLNTLLSDEPDRPSQAEIGREFGMTENAVKQAFHRLRQRYRQLLREEVAHTVATPAEIEDELRHLIAVLRT
jgi:DNA-directed RNA polymerase specialized sigma24 family protein